jgi:hypothetical protein
VFNNDNLYFTSFGLSLWKMSLIALLICWVCNLVPTDHASRIVQRTSVSETLDVIGGIEAKSMELTTTDNLIINNIQLAEWIIP